MRNEYYLMTLLVSKRRIMEILEELVLITFSKSTMSVFLLDI